MTHEKRETLLVSQSVTLTSQRCEEDGQGERIGARISACAKKIWADPILWGCLGGCASAGSINDQH